MENTEIIKALRYCGNFEDRDGCDEECPYFNDKDCPKRIMCDAADALEECMKKENAIRLLIDGRGDPVSCNVDAILMGEYEWQTQN